MFATKNYRGLESKNIVPNIQAKKYHTRISQSQPYVIVMNEVCLSWTLNNGDEI